MTHKLNRLLALVLAVIMTFSMLLVPVEAASFQDVKDGAWYAAAVEYVSEKGWMAGVSETSFAPAKEVTRGMMVTVLARIAGAKTDNDAPAFADTGAGKWYTGAAAWAAENGIVRGVGGNRFVPNRAITRQDLCVMLYSYVKAMGIELENTIDRTFADMDSVAKYAREAVIYCTGTGLISGFEDSTFRPKDSATRAQLAQILMRLDLLIKGETAPTEPMPAQSFEGNAGEDMNISVEAPEGALPENTSMTVSRITDEGALHSIETKVFGDVVAAADITFTKNGEEIEPETEVEVQLELAGLDGIENPVVVHIKDDGTVEHINSEMVSTTRGGGKALRFHAKDFSVYAVVGDETFNNNMLTISFYARQNGTSGAWKIVNKQLIRADQLYDATNSTRLYPITDPGVPNITTSQAFEGWIPGGTTFDPGFTYTTTTASKTVKQINEDHNASTLTADAEVVYYAAVFDVVYITYHDQAGAATYAEYKKIPEGASSVDVTITESYVPMKSNQNFSGWVTMDEIVTLGKTDGTLPRYKTTANANKWPTGSQHALSSNVDLYPYVEEGFWLSFNNNIAKNSEKLQYEDDTSAEYISPKFYAKGVAPGSAPAFTSATPRPGYVFDKWYKDADMTEEFNFGDPLTKDTTVYAGWTFGTTTYTIVYWKQKPTDPVNTANSAKTYDYFSFRSVENVTTGSIVGISTTGTNNDTNKDVSANNENGFYFQFNANKSDKNAANSTVRVKGDGTTVLNVYYDRKTITYKFGPSATPTYGTLSNPVWNYDTINYYKSGTSYYQCFGYVSGGTQYYLKQVTGDLSTSSTYYIRVYDDIYAYKYDSDYRDYVWYDDVRDGYYLWSGEVFAAYTTEPSPVYTITNMTLTSVTATHSGLYGAQYAAADWPSAGSGNTWSCYDYSDGVVYQYPLRLTEYVPTWQNQTNPTDAYLTMNFYVSEYTTDTIPVKYVGASLDNANLYNVELATGTARKGGNWFPTETIQGYTIKGYVFRSSAPTANTTWTSCTTSSEIAVGASQTGTLYVAFDRNVYDLTFVSTTGQGTQSEVIHNLKFGDSLSSYSSHVPANDYEGHYFVGWYEDEALTKPYTFTGKTVPANNTIVYAKWNPKWYRIVVDYKRGDDTRTITVPGSTQKASFTVQYGSTIQTSALLKARRTDADGNDNWMLVGLYLDKACNQPFNENMQAPFGLTEAQEIYPAGSRTGVDDITGDTWSDEEWPDIRAKITLYAKWRENPEGVTGIKVRYLGDHAENDKGYFDTNKKPHTVIMDEVYTDTARASAHSATVPSLPNQNTKDNSRRFLYWEIMQPVKDSEGNYVTDDDGNVVLEPSGETVYPGAPFDIEIGKAVEVKTLLPDPNCKHKNSDDSSAIVEVGRVDPTCTEPGVAAHYECELCHRLFTDAAGANETTQAALVIPATDHDWETNDPTYVWSVQSFDENTVPTCTATLLCGHDETHVLTETVEGHLIVEGQTGHYLAEFEDTHFEDQESDTFRVSRAVVTYKVNGETVTGLTETVTPGGTITLPTDAEVPEFAGYTFLGWVTAAVADTTTSQTYAAPGASQTINGDTTYHALYTREVDTGSTRTVYRLVSDDLSDWTGNYVVTCLNTTDLYVLDQLAGGSTYESQNTGCASYASSGMTLEDGKLLNVAQRYVFKFASRTNGYSMQNAANSAYVARYATSSAAGSLRSYSSYNATYCRWSFAFQPEGNVRILNVYNTNYSTSYPYLGFTRTTNEDFPCFWCDNLGENSESNAALNMYLWKEEVEDVTQTHYTTSIQTCTVTYSVPAGVTAPDPATMTVVVGQTVTLPAAPEGTPDGYTFAGWVTAPTSNSTTRPATVLDPGASQQISGNTTFYALYTYEQGTGNYVYQLVDDLENGGEYILVDSESISGTTGYAVGNTVPSGSIHWMARVSVTINSDDTCTVTSANLPKVLWQATGSAADGYSFYNAAVGKYLGYDASEYLYPSSTALVWVYTSARYLDNQIDSGNYFYLSYDGDNSRYTTSKSGSVINLYQKVEETTSYYTTSISANPVVVLTSYLTDSNPNSLASDEPESEFTPESTAMLVEAQPIDLSSGLETDEEFNAVTVPNPVTASTDKYEVVTSFTAGKKILITNGSYILSTTLAQSDWGPYGQRFTASSAGNGQYTISLNNTNYASDASELLFTVGGNSAGWTFNHPTAGYLNFITGEYLGFGDTNNAWTLSGSKLRNTSANSYPYVYFKTGTGYYYYSSNQTGDNLTFYQLVEETAPTYTVSVASGITNGTVTADKYTVTEGQTVTLTVNPDDGYMIDTVTVTTPARGTVEVTRENDNIYTFVMPASNVTVNATFNAVMSDEVWTVSFKDEDGDIIPGMNPIYVPKTEPTLNENDLPDSSMEDQYFLGWYQGNTQCTFPMPVTSDITLTPHYSPMYSYDYTLTLRAVYGMYNPDATTHIFWYSNNNTALHNGAGERYTSVYKTTVEGVETSTTKVPINGRVDIPLPEGPEGQTVYVGDNGGSLTYEDHVFLGWARVENDGSGTEGEEQFLTADDLYIHWINGKYYAKNKYGNLVETTQAYADETQPYRDMYAVWSGYCYIFHSSTGKMEAIEVTGTRGDVDRINIAKRVESGKLYGGYYKTYGGVSGITMRPFQNSALSKAADSTQVDKKVEVTGAENYNGSSSKTTGNVRFWTKADAYGQFTVKVNGVNVTHNDDPGTALTPTVGTIYYLKEVPDDYLTTKYLYTYDTDNQNQIKELFEMTLVDDSYYKSIGFRTVDNADTLAKAQEGELINRQSLAGAVSVKPKNNEATVVNAASFGKTSGFVALTKTSNVTGNTSFSLLPGWTTLDGVDINSRGGLYLSVNSGKTAITWKLLEGCNKTTPLTSFYVQLADGFKNDYLKINNEREDFAQTWLYFFNNSTYRWIQTTAVGGTNNSLWRADFPAGDWQGVIVVRGNPDEEAHWTTEGDNRPVFVWNQTNDINPTNGNFNNRSGFNLVTITGWGLTYDTGLFGETP